MWGKKKKEPLPEKVEKREEYRKKARIKRGINEAKASQV